jgi:hypothetical protein
LVGLPLRLLRRLLLEPYQTIRKWSSSILYHARRWSCSFTYEEVKPVEPQNLALAASASAPPFFKEPEPSQRGPNIYPVVKYKYFQDISMIFNMTNYL